MHVCMYVCSAVHETRHACMHVCMYACMHVCMYACMHAWIATIHTRIHVYTYTNSCLISFVALWLQQRLAAKRSLPPTSSYHRGKTYSFLMSLSICVYVCHCMCMYDTRRAQDIQCSYVFVNLCVCMPLYVYVWHQEGTRHTVLLCLCQSVCMCTTVHVCMILWV
jgi:hypothetical protein